MRTRQWLLAVLVAVTAPTVATRAAETGSLEGVLLDGIAHAPVADARVAIRPLLLTATTDAEGRFSFRDLPPGEYRLEIQHVAYLHVVVGPFAIRAGATVEIQLGLERAQFVETVLVRPVLRVPAPTPAGEIAAETITGMPGTLDDPLRGLISVPGVSNVNDFKAEIRIRGAEIEDTLFRLDGTVLENPYHFPWARGSTSALNPVAFDRVVVHSSGLRPELGDTVAGVVELEVSERGQDALFLDASLGTLVTSVAGGGSLAEGGSWMAAARYSNLALYHGLYDVENIDVPTYGDAIVRGRLPVSARTEVLAGALMLASDLTTADEETGGTDEKSTRGEGLYAGFDTALASGTRLAGRASHWRTEQLADTMAGDHIVARSDRLRMSFDAAVDAESWGWRAGLEGASLTGQIEGAIQSAGAILPLDVRTTRYGFYAAMSYSPSSQWTIEAGWRTDRDDRWGYAPVQPRVRAEYASEAGWTVNVSASRYTQYPRFEQEFLAQGESAGIAVADEVAAGARLSFVHSWNGEATVYARRLKNLTSERVNQFPDLPEPMTGFERGRSHGLELALRRDAGRFRLRAAATLQRTFQEESGAVFPRNGDQPWRTDITAAYRIDDGWEVVARLQAADGLPYTPYVPASDGERLLGPLNGARLPDYARLDLRSSWQWRLRSYDLRVFVEVDNVTDRDNVRGRELRYDRASKTYAHHDSLAMPLVPGFGLEVAWSPGR